MLIGGLRGACRRAGHFGPDPLAQPTLRNKQKKEAERRQTCFLTSASFGCGARPDLFSLPRVRGRVGRGHARLSAFHHGSDRRGSRPFGATPGQASWDVAGRSVLYGRPNRGAQASRCSTGVTRARLSQSRESTSRTGRSAGQHDARSCPGADCIVPHAGTALAPPSGVPSRWRPLRERDSQRCLYLKWRLMSIKKRPLSAWRLSAS